MTTAYQRRDSHGERGCGASWNCEERSYRQVERAGKEIAVPFGDSAGHLHQTAAAGDAERHNTQKRHADRCDEHAKQRRHQTRAGFRS